MPSACDDGEFHFTYRPQGDIFHNVRQHIISHFADGKIFHFPGGIMAESKLRDLSVDFAVKIIRLCETIKGHYSLVNQLERSSTSIGANIHEANYAHSKADFIARFRIALKECYETEYWLELFVKSDIIDRKIAEELYRQCGTIRRILIASINTAREHIQ